MISMPNLKQSWQQVRKIHLSRGGHRAVTAWLGEPLQDHDPEWGECYWTDCEDCHRIGDLSIEHCTTLFGVVPGENECIEVSVEYTENLLIDTIGLLIEAQNETAKGATDVT